MSTRGPSLHSRRLWPKREAKCLATVADALGRLRNRLGLPETEVELNRHFYFCLLEASRELYPEDEIAPVAECNNQPDPDDEACAKRKLKRPDFQWAYLDRYETDPRRSSKQFVVECKRLGNSGRADWVLNQNYANHGIIRFRDPEWAYAKRVPSGAMVGYWQNMEAHEVLTEVTEETRKRALPDMVLVGAWSPGGVSHLEHTFERTFEISPFKVHHLWIDLRLTSRADGRQ